MSKLVLGVDGGATKSHLAVFDSSGKCVASETYGPLNHEVMRGSYAELEERLTELLPRVVKSAGATIDDISYAVLGLAGVDTDAQQVLISNIISKIGFKNQMTCNDAFLGVPAGCPNCVGICAINGTGFKHAAIDNSGNAVQTCGLGIFTDDLGGGSWYGNRAIGSVYNEIYKLGRSTIMKDMIFELLGISRREDYLEVLTEKLETGNIDRVALNSITFAAAARDDAVALGILEESAEQYAGAIARLIMDLDFPKSKPVYVALAGSVFVRQKVKILQEMIAMRVDSALDSQEVIYTELDAPPVVGAVMWAAQKAGFEFDIDKVKAELNIVL
ncbi:MAG: hypothetical protein FWD05_05990 [Oscillospiraceae bacterium]|nr:hypothetical protein [Oscillospiraceae bacterium]